MVCKYRRASRIFSCNRRRRRRTRTVRVLDTKPLPPACSSSSPLVSGLPTNTATRVKPKPRAAGDVLYRGGGGLGVGASSSRGGGTARTGPGHDRCITVFSPEGRLYQLEYALNAVKLAGITSVAVRGVDSVSVVTQHDKDPIDPLLDRTDPVFSRVFAITERVGMLATGMAADGRALVHEARNQAAEFRFKWGYEIPPRVLAQWIADRAQVRTQHAGMRPYGVVATIFGIDEQKGTPELFTCDPAGICLGCKAASAGLKDSEAIKYLEEKMAGNPSLSFESAGEMALNALAHVLGDTKCRDIEVGSVEKEEPILIFFLPAAGQSSIAYLGGVRYVWIEAPCVHASFSYG